MKEEDTTITLYFDTAKIKKLTWEEVEKIFDTEVKGVKPGFKKYLEENGIIRI